MDLALFGYALPLIRQEWGLSLGDLRYVLFFSFAIGGLVLVWLGTLTDRFGRKRMLIGSIFASSGAVALHGLAPGPFTLTFLRGLAVATGGLTYPVSGALVTEEAPARYRGLYAGMLQTGYPAGWFVAALLAAPLMEAYGWRPLFLVGLLSIPYAFIVKRWLKESSRFEGQTKRADHRGTSAQKIRTILAPPYRRLTLTLFVAQFTFVLAYAGSAILFPLYFEESRNFDLGSAVTLVGIGNGISIFGYALASWIGEYVLTRRTTVVIWTFAGATAFLWMIWGTDTYAESLVAFGVMSIFFYGAAAVKFAFVAELFPTRVRATGLSVASSLAVTLGTATGPVLVLTAVETWGWDIAFSLTVAVPLYLAGAAYLLLKPVPSGLEVEEIEQRIAGESR